MAAVALGSSVGAIALIRVTGPAIRQRMTAPMAIMACAILTTMALRPELPGILVILFVSGLCYLYQVQANAAFVAAVPGSQRGQAFGLALGGMQVDKGQRCSPLAPLRSPPALGWPSPQQVPRVRWLPPSSQPQRGAMGDLA